MNAPPSPPESKAFGAPPAWVVFVVAITLEYLAVSFSVDARDLLAPADLQHALGQIGEVAPLAFLFPAAVFLTGGLEVRLRLRELSAYRKGKSATFLLALLHVIFATAFIAFASWLATANASAQAARTWLLLWLGLGCASLLTLAFALWSPKMIAQALAGLKRELLIGLGVSTFAWVAGLLSRTVWKPLAWLTLEIVHAALTLLTSDPVASIDEALVGTSRFYVQVAPVCSGMEGVALMLTFVTTYLFLHRQELRWPRALVLLPLSAVLVWGLNVVRVTALIGVGTLYSPQVALGGFHSKAGWVFFALAALTTVYVVQRSPAFHLHPEATFARVPEPQPLEADHGALTAAYLAPLLAVLASKLVTGLTADGIDYFYGVSVVAAALALYKFRNFYPRPSMGSPWLPLGAGLTVAVLWIVGFGDSEGVHPLGEQLRSLSTPATALWLTLRAIGTIVTVPVVEELAFRGYLFRRFRAPAFQDVPYRDFSWLGLIVSSVAFGLLHSHWMLGIAAGFVFGLLTIVRGRLSDALIAHAAANAALFAYALGTKHWALIA